jgi:hypothetical protein
MEVPIVVPGNDGHRKNSESEPAAAASRAVRSGESVLDTNDEHHEDKDHCELSSSSGMRRRRVNRSSNSDKVRSGSSGISSSSSGSVIEVDAKDTKKDSSPASTPAEPVPPVAAASEDASPWRKWLEQSATEFIQKASERTATAIDVISTATSSAAVRKRKKKGEVESGALGSDGTAGHGVGTVFVNLISAYRVSP